MPWLRIHTHTQTWSVTDITVSNEELWVIFSDHEGTSYIRHCWYDDRSVVVVCAVVHFLVFPALSPVTLLNRVPAGVLAGQPC